MIRKCASGGLWCAVVLAVAGMSVVHGDQSASCDTEWEATFGGYPGAMGSSVRCIISSPIADGPFSGTFVGGSISSIAGGPANWVARYDGSGWTNVGDGPGGLPMALAIHDDGHGLALYAAGAFVLVGDDPLNRIARWDGRSWSSVGGGFDDGEVRALAVVDLGDGPALYAAGTFTQASGEPRLRVARWDGETWLPLANGISGQVNALVAHDDGSGTALYAGGSFSFVSGQQISSIARWDGQAWSAVSAGPGSIVGSVVHSFASVTDDDGSKLYAGTATAGVRVWDGVSWASLGGGVSGIVRSVISFDDGLADGPTTYIGGTFSAAGGEPAANVARFDGETWTGVVAGMNKTVYALGTRETGRGPELLAGGPFTTAGEKWLRRLVRLVIEDGEPRWAALGVGIHNPVSTLAVHDDGSGFGQALYIGGHFWGIGERLFGYIARWNGPGADPAWDDLGGGVAKDPDSSGGATQVRRMLAFDDGLGDGPVLFVSGRFGFAGDVMAKNIARWNGTTWSSLGAGVDNIAHAMAIFDDGLGAGPALYVGGNFQSAGGVAAPFIARWDGVSWSPVGGGVDGTVFALHVADDGSGPALFVGGNFLNAGGVAARRVARWDGSAWSPLGDGLGDENFATVRDFVDFPRRDGQGVMLVATGHFHVAADQTVDHIAAWDGNQWSALPSDTGVGLTFEDAPGTVIAIGHDLMVRDTTSGPEIVVVGQYSAAAGVPAASAAAWRPTPSGGRWRGLHTGTPHLLIQTTEFDDGDGTRLYVGGWFAASDVADSYLARWHACPTSTEGDLDGDGVVNGADLGILLASWGPCASNDSCAADLNGDGVVDGADLGILLANWS